MFAGLCSYSYIAFGFSAESRGTGGRNAVSEKRDFRGSRTKGASGVQLTPPKRRPFPRNDAHPGAYLAAGEQAAPAASLDQLHEEVRMSQTTMSSSLTTLWNMAAPLHVLLIENSAADA